MKKKLILIPILVLVLMVSMTMPVLARDEEDPLVASNEYFWNVNGWDNDGVQQLGPTGKGCMGAQHPDWTDKHGNWNVAVPTGYNLYRDDVSGSGNLDKVVFRTDTPEKITVNPDYLTESKWEHWKNCPLGRQPPDYTPCQEVDNPDCIWYTKLTYKNTDDACWYWAKEPRGYDYPELAEPKPVPDPNRFQVFMNLGWDWSKYVSKSDNTLRRSIEVSGEYNGTQYMLEIPKGCVIEQPSGKRLHGFILKEIDGDILTFSSSNVEFSEPCVLYMAEGGRIYRDRMTGEWAGDGEWTKVGAFISIAGGKAVLSAEIYLKALLLVAALE